MSTAEATIAAIVAAFVDVMAEKRRTWVVKAEAAGRLMHPATANNYRMHAGRANLIAERAIIAAQPDGGEIARLTSMFRGMVENPLDGLSAAAAGEAGGDALRLIERVKTLRHLALSYPDEAAKRAQHIIEDAQRMAQAIRARLPERRGRPQIERRGPRNAWRPNARTTAAE